MTATFRLNGDELNESFLAKLRLLYGQKEIDVVVFESSASTTRPPSPQPGSFDENYLNGLIEKARASWSGIGNVDEWLENVRGYSRA